MEVLGHDKKIFWGVDNDHVVEDQTYHKKIGIQGFD